MRARSSSEHGPRTSRSIQITDAIIGPAHIIFLVCQLYVMCETSFNAIFEIGVEYTFLIQLLR